MAFLASASCARQSARIPPLWGAVRPSVAATRADPTHSAGPDAVLFFVHRRFSLATGPHRWFRPTALPTSGGTLHTDYDCYDQRQLSVTVVIAVIAT